MTVSVSIHDLVAGEQHPNLRDDIQPGVDLNICEPAHHCMTDVVVRAIFEPQGEQSQSILQCICPLQSNRPEES